MTPPVFAHGHLRLYLLSLLAERPMHGYDLIQALGERFGGTYVPSAGTIYPRLGKLEEEGLVTKTVDGRRTTYDITEAGRAELAERGPELDEIEADVTDSVRRLADEVRASVDGAMRTLKAELAAAAREARADAREAGRNERMQPPTARTEGRARVQQAEAALNEFRAHVRTDLRSRADGVSVETLDVLTRGLQALRDEVKASARSSR